MKKMVTTLVAGALALSMFLVGCGGTQTETESGTEEEQTTEEASEEAAEQAAEAIDGGWSVVSEATPQVSADEQALFDKALEGLTGVTYTPIKVLATQVVAGTNYAFLCQGTTVTAEPVTSWYVVVVYQDLEGGTELTSIADLDGSNIKTAADTDDDSVVGGWQVVEAADAQLVPAEAKTAFDKAYETHAGVDLYPFATISSQLVAGTNYRILCVGKAASPEAALQLYVVDVYADLDGNAEFTSVELFDLLSYLGA